MGPLSPFLKIFSTILRLYLAIFVKMRFFFVMPYFFLFSIALADTLTKKSLTNSLLIFILVV